jgi:hypothetical protein
MSERVRDLFQEMEHEVRALPLLPRLEVSLAGKPARRRRRLVLVAAATAAAVAAAVAGVGLLPRDDDLTTPITTPPKVFRLAGTVSTTPGPLEMVVVITDPVDNANRPPYAVPGAGGGGVLRVAVPAEAAQNAGMDIRLSPDGTRLVYLVHSSNGNITVQDLVTGRSTTAGRDISAFSEVSPDNRTLAVVLPDGIELRDLETGTSRPLRGAAPGAGSSRLGWSPAGDLLALGQDTSAIVLDLEGGVRARLGAGALVAGSMSWSPDGRSVLLYDSAAGQVVVAGLDGNRTTVVRPENGVRALGWAGERVVWLVQDGEDQRLVTTDTAGGDPTTWMRFGPRTGLVETVLWSDALRGGPEAVPGS